MAEKIEREIVLARACAKYIDSGQTKNITTALRLYLKNDAGPDEQIDVFIIDPIDRALRSVLKTTRPECELCGGLLMLQYHAVDFSKKVWPTAWHCPKCGVIEYSDQTPEQWLRILEDEAGSKDLHTGHEPHEIDLST
jgi:ribosomal protein S27AE